MLVGQTLRPEGHRLASLVGEEIFALLEDGHTVETITGRPKACFMHRGIQLFRLVGLELLTAGIELVEIPAVLFALIESPAFRPGDWPLLRQMVGRALDDLIGSAALSSSADPNLPPGT